MRLRIWMLLTALTVFADEPTKFTLAQCIEYAMEHSPTVAKQELVVRNQKLQTLIEEAQFD